MRTELFLAWRYLKPKRNAVSLITVSSILGHFIGAGLAIKNGSKIVKPAIILVLILLAAKVVQGLIAG